MKLIVNIHLLSFNSFFFNLIFYSIIVHYGNSNKLFIVFITILLTNYYLYNIHICTIVIIITVFEIEQLFVKYINKYSRFIVKSLIPDLR